MKRKTRMHALKRDEFLSLVSHEIRNPLTSINGYTEFAADAVKNHDETLALESLQVVRSEAQRVLRLAEDLLDAAQVKAGRFSVTPESIDFEEVVWQVVSRYAATTSRMIRMKMSPNPFPRIFGDAIRLGQVVENLISNATKYSPPELPILVLLVAADHRVAMSVWNLGPAIPEKRLSQMFQKFSRVRETNEKSDGTGVIKGNGLGLFISQQIVKMHGGVIRAWSREDDGTIFTMELPHQPALVLGTGGRSAGP
jgi:signal transduction histidine kinase